MKLKYTHTLQIRLLLFILTLTITLTGCSKEDKTSTSTNNNFKEYANKLFTDIVTSDGLTLNYTLNNPAKYGIEQYPTTLGVVPLTTDDYCYKKADKILNNLSKYKYNDLSTEEQYAYDTISWYYNNLLKSKEYIYFNEYLSPTEGVQIQLPILLSEFHFNTTEDIDHYLALLKDVDRYFSDICTFEEKKAAAGLFMSRASAYKVLTQCKNILADINTSTFITSFNNNIEAIEGITRNQIYEYEKENDNLVNTTVKNAYTNLYKTIYTLTKNNNNSGCLVDYPFGKDYYSLKANTITGSNRSTKNIISILENTITLNNSQLMNLISKNKDIDRIDLTTNYGINDTSDIISSLKDKMDKYFPEISDVEYSIKNVPTELTSFLNPAFYVASTLDNYQKNTIYINSAAMYNGNPLFTNIAHETFPGHLYQNAYFCQNNKLPIRNIIKNQGYIEGWASYITNLSYSYTDMDPVKVSISKFNDAIVLCLSARADIGVHYEGWTRNDINTYFTENNCTLNASAIDSLYNIIIDDPGSYLSYAVGYIEISRLLEDAKDNMQDNFSLKKFHKFILDAGPTPFSSIKSHIEDELYNNDKH